MKQKKKKKKKKIKKKKKKKKRTQVEIKIAVSNTAKLETSNHTAVSWSRDINTVQVHRNEVYTLPCCLVKYIYQSFLL